MEACRWWMGVAGVVVGVATFGTVVGTACWHMAYEEALLQAAAREQRILDLLTENFRQHITSLTEQLEERNTLVTKLLNNDTSSPLPQPIGSEYRSARGAHPQLADAPGDINTRSLSTHNSPSPAVLQQSHTKQTQTVVIGVLGSLTLSVTSVLDAWMELQQSDPISRDVRLVLSPCLTRETLVEDVARLYQDLGVQVFLDDPTTDEVGQLADWAASRPSPRWPVVFVLPSTPPAWKTLERKDLEKDLAVVAARPSLLLHLLVTLHQIRAEGLVGVLPLVEVGGGPRSLAGLFSLWNLDLGVHVMDVVHYSLSTPIEDIVDTADAILQSFASDRVGVLVDSGPRLLELAVAAAGHRLSKMPWFLMAKNLVVDLLNTEQVNLRSLDLNIVEYKESSHNVNNMNIYNTLVSAIHFGYTLKRDRNSSLNEVMKDVTGTNWTGLTGSSENLLSFKGAYLCLKTKTNSTEVIDVLSRQSYITLQSLSPRTYILDLNEKYIKVVDTIH
nr:uncharacterized protein LOC123758788 isoform X1 [Procambarus clarkii]